MAPGWVVTLDASADWGIPPWELTGESKLLWWLRYGMLREERTKAREKD